jgi:hypothetical protein
MRPRTRRALLWALGVGLAVLLVGAALLATLAAQINGGWDEVFDRTHPTEDDPEVVAARAAAAARLDAETGRVVDTVVLPALDGGRVTQPAATGGDAVDDPALGSRCEVGQHNWKIDDPFDLACVEVRRAVVAGSDADVRAQLTSLDEALRSDGCRSEDLTGLVFTIDYWDRNHGAYPNSPSGDDTYGPEDLPSASCLSADGTYQVSVHFSGFDLFTGQPAPVPADGEFQLMISVGTQSYSA